MTFLHPILLGAGIACISIPIIIHFFMRRRRRPMPWAAMRFLMEAYKRRRRRLQFEQWLLLALRCLLIALLALAFGRPMLGDGIDGGRRTVTIVLDDSMTSTANGAFEGLRDQALALIDDLNGLRGDTVGFITTAPATARVSPPSPDLDAVRRLIENHRPTDAVQDLAGALDLVDTSDGA
ncbi:MAG: BatA domain-containing protein, partial [Phycisphaerales bacterium]|nr:BatA domain-containing protein [Phycisphaerales bacterium]